MITWLRRHWQSVVNWILFVSLGRFALRQRLEAWRQGRFDWLEGFFILQNLVGLSALLVRDDHRALDRRAWPQIVALAAFFSGMGFDQRETSSPAVLRAARLVTFLALITGILAFLSLGRSFGILVAARRVQTDGMYRFVRHPMYLSDLLWRIAFILKNNSAKNLVLFLVSSLGYVYRAILEERFLSDSPVYREYRRQVKFRFVPGVF